MKKLGVKYFIFNSGDYGVCTKGENDKRFIICQTRDNFKKFIEEHGELVHAEGSVLLYLLK